LREKALVNQKKLPLLLIVVWGREEREKEKMENNITTFII
jgi:hypothetical protein